MEGLKLYQPRTIVPEFPHRGQLYKDVQLTWLMDRRRYPAPFEEFISPDAEPVAPFAEAIQNYDRLEDSNKFYAEESLQELFTERELKQLQEYLLLAHDDREALAEEVSLPLVSKSFPLSGIPVGGSSGWYDLHQEPEYSLPFKVFGFFDVDGYEVIGRSEPDKDSSSLPPLLEGFEEGYDGFETMEGPSPDDPIWAAALPAPPMLYQTGAAPLPETGQRAGLYAQLGLSSEQVLFLETLELQHGTSIQEMLRTLVTDLMSSEKSGRSELAKSWLHTLTAPTMTREGWRYLWKVSS
jgi:hypothetical protein